MAIVDETLNWMLVDVDFGGTKREARKKVLYWALLVSRVAGAVLSLSLLVEVRGRRSFSLND